MARKIAILCIGCVQLIALSIYVKINRLLSWVRGTHSSTIDKYRDAISALGSADTKRDPDAKRITASINRFYQALQKKFQ